MLNREEIRRKVYEKYKLDWMIHHNRTLEEFIGLLPNSGSTADKIEFFEETGFGNDGGSIWASYEEFIGVEYQDQEFVRSLLSNDEFDDYRLDIDTAKVCIDAVVADRHYYDGLTIEEMNELAAQLGCTEFVPFTVAPGCGYFVICLVSKDYAEETQLDFNRLTKGIEHHLVTTNTDTRYGVVEIDSLNVLFWR